MLFNEVNVTQVIHPLSSARCRQIASRRRHLPRRRLCRGCGEWFLPRRRSQWYCAARCRMQGTPAAAGNPAGHFSNTLMAICGYFQPQCQFSASIVLRRWTYVHGMGQERAAEVANRLLTRSVSSDAANVRLH